MVRQVTIHDFPAITTLRMPLIVDRAKINEPSYKSEIENTGFLVGEYTQEEFLHDINSPFYVYDNGNIQGYLRISSEQEFIDNDRKVWQEMKHKYYGQPHAEIAAIAVSLKDHQKGIASQLLEAAIQELQGKGVPYLFSIVMIEPFTNKPSLSFHEKYGFKKIAYSQPSNLFGLENVQSVLLAKQL